MLKYIRFTNNKQIPLGICTMHIKKTKWPVYISSYPTYVVYIPKRSSKYHYRVKHLGFTYAKRGNALKFQCHLLWWRISFVSVRKPFVSPCLRFDPDSFYWKLVVLINVFQWNTLRLGLNPPSSRHYYCLSSKQDSFLGRLPAGLLLAGTLPRGILPPGPLPPRKSARKNFCHEDICSPDLWPYAFCPETFAPELYRRCVHVKNGCFHKTVFTGNSCRLYAEAL